MKREDVFDQMVRKWDSALVSRSEVGKFSGGMIAPRTLANADSLGQGPARKITMGARRVGYDARELAAWLRDRCQVVTKEA